MLSGGMGMLGRRDNNGEPTTDWNWMLSILKQSMC